MHFDVFSQGQSFWHALDPRLKIVFFVPLVFVIALLSDGFAAFFYFVLSIAFVASARINRKELGARLAALNVFIGLLWLTLPFSFEGKALFAIRHFVFTFEGVRYVFVLTLKANAILMLTITMIGTTDVFSLAHALFHLKCPRKLVYLFVFLYRYISVLHEEYDRLNRTIRARSFVPRTDMKTLKTCAYMVGMLFINSYERSQRVYQALTLRGFRGDFPMLRHFHLHPQDTLFSIVMLLILGARFIFV